MRQIRNILLINVLFFVGINFLGCSTTSKNLNSRITEAQKEWRYSGVPFYGEQKPPVDLSIQGQLQGMLDNIVFVSPLRGYRVPIILVDSDNPAFTDGKSVYLNAAFAQVFWQDKSLIAMVVAHEFSHILANHNPESGREVSILYSAASPLLSFVKFGAYANLALRESLMMGKRAYSRSQEKEADEMAVFLGDQAGYDVYGLIRFFDYIDRARKGQLGSLTIPVTNYANPSSAISAVAVSVLRSSALYKTHPSPTKRIQNLKQMISEKKQGVLNAGIKNSQKYNSKIYQSLEQRRPK